MTEAYSINRIFTKFQRQLLLELDDLFKKYPELNLTTDQIGYRWGCAGRTVRNLFMKLREIGAIEEVQVRYNEYIRMPTSKFYEMMKGVK